MSSLKMMLSLALAIALTAMAVMLHGAFALPAAPAMQGQPASAAIDFASCAREEGSTVRSGEPATCRTADGRIFAAPIQVLPADAAVSKPFVGPGCQIGGCSEELCVDAGSEDVISTCIYRPQFACYRTARCEMQSDGHCAWSETATLAACIASTSPGQASSTGYIRMEVQ